MNNTFTKSLLALAVSAFMVAGSAAQTATSEAGPGVKDPGHPRVNQVNRRDTPLHTAIQPDFFI